MASATAMVAAGGLAAASAVLLLRWAWGRDRRSVPLNGAAWALLAAGELIAMAGAGAWGVAIAALCAMIAASACLAWAAWTAPVSKATASNRRVHALPEGNEPRHTARRIVTFLLIVPAGMIASLLIALAARALADLAGWSEANSAALFFYLMPLAWTFYATALLMGPRRRTQIAMLALPSAASLALLAASGATQ